MPLHPKIKAGLQFAEALPRVDQLSPEAARVQLRDLWLSVPKKQPPPPLAKVEDRTISVGANEIPIRVYTPVGSGPFPIVTFIHGGGFVLGDLESYDDLCRRIAGLVQAVVIAPEYRLAPEHKYPAAIDDCVSTIIWSCENASELNALGSQCAVAGDSAGGNLALMCALRLRDRNFLRAQLLMYPVTDHYSGDFVSYREFAEGFGLTASEMRWFWDHYLAEECAEGRQYASPLRAESCAGLPATLLVSAECDVLRDEGEAMANRLASEGVDVTLQRAMGMNHGFFMLAGALPEAAAFLDEACAWLRSALTNQPRDALFRDRQAT
ncbi:alpha/beta hydrolase [Rhizorhapis sp. SPR117]|uniref:alpha/beta hydrolase n=1 Tax=Rhizorhapis sp. SPR117 TaxID=2912611 RepID=UPI001F29D3BA|nr:alpha/beta hydrolase [Rhizorhapis sp. SPR117]